MTCEITHTTGSGKHRVERKCGKPAVFWWSPGIDQRTVMAVCAEHGPLLAENFKHELTPIKNKNALGTNRGHETN